MVAQFVETVPLDVMVTVSSSAPVRNDDAGSMGNPTADAR
jgi:hypothetical protein